jgi:hypothetical protein
MPKPKPGETEAEFVARYMSSEEAKRDFPEEKQRLAVAYSEYKKHRKEVEFSVFTPVVKSWEDKIEVDKGVESQRFIQVIVSGIAEDRDGERMSKEAIEDMIMQYKSGTIPLFPDHGKNESGERTYSWKNIMGVWVDAFKEGDHLVAVARLNKAHPDAALFWNYLQEKMPIGFSIGGKPSIVDEEIIEETSVELNKEVKNEEKTSV